MINALRYEPRGQRQRFEPRVQQPVERQEQDRHIYLHFHLNLTFRARQGRSISPNANLVKSMLSALAAATVIPLWLFPWAIFPTDGPPPPAWDQLLMVWSFVSQGVGLVLAWCAVGILLCRVWRASPRERLGLVLPLALLLLIVFLTSAFFWLPNSGLLWGMVMALGTVTFMGVFLAHPLMTALLFGRVSREARRLRQQSPTHSKLGFVAAAGMVFLLLGGLLFNVSALLSGGITPLVILLPATCMAVIVTIRTSVWLFRSRGRMQAHPKDPSHSDVDLFREQNFSPVDPRREEGLEGDPQ